MMTIKLLGRFGLGLHADTKYLLEVCQKLLNVQNSDSIFFDFSDVQFLYPSGINALVGLGGYLINQKGCTISQNYPNNPETKNFLVESGFYKTVGVEAKTDPNIPPHNGSRIFKIKNFAHIDDDAISEMIDVIEQELQLSGNVRADVHGNIAELILNVQQHSKSRLNCFVIGQGYSTTHRVRFCITDLGIGIKTHLGNKYKDLLKKDATCAIEKALEEGVTGTTDNENAGVGLSYFKQFVDFCKGSFRILSGDGYYAEERDERGRKSVEKIALDFEFPGTLVDFTIRSKPGLKIFHKKEPIPKEYRLIK